MTIISKQLVNESRNNDGQKYSLFDGINFMIAIKTATKLKPATPKKMSITWYENSKCLQPSKDAFEHTILISGVNLHA
jgi:hypothetical protein